ncbi:glycosyl transferase [Sporosarcina sp. P2]|uniref:glycosyltransferase family 2 protein n=1 Tax=Sporosarcina sp. P2 TaxID=2048251 RepID=UPI000C162EC8|nr:glycosyltransferase family 2 protein [Sporosarcina sp. P2]PID01098.1 glycosyl transferase [Sporosarcina sp. P2]
MITISLCMIVKDEETVIGRCLDSVKDLVDEINIVDTGSTDLTKQIVSAYTERVFDFSWKDHFADARNYSFQQATKEYVLWLDADDVFTQEDRERFINLKQQLTSDYDAVTMNYHLSFDEEGQVTSSLKRHRLVKRENNFIWIGAVHEYLSVSGNILDSEVAVTHLPLSHDCNRNLRIYENKLASGEDLSPRDTFYYANELADHEEFKGASLYYEEFLDSEAGWVEDNIRACFKLADCYQRLGQPKKALAATLRSLSYDAPRPEACCRLGYHFMEKANNEAAIQWYSQALQTQESRTLSFHNKAFSTWLPHLQLCVLYDRLQAYEVAYQHNEAARFYKPNDPSIKHNKSYLEEILKTDD